MVALNSIVQEYRLEATTVGVDKALAASERLVSAETKLAAAQEKAAGASDKGNAANDRAARSKAAAEAAASRMQRQIEAENQALAAMQSAQDAVTASTGGLTAAQLAAVNAYAAATRAGNDNAAAVEKQGQAFKAAGKFIAEHPVLVLAGSVVAARALSGLAATAATSLGAASASTAAFAEGAAGMGATVVTGAALASRGFAGLSAGATVAASGLGKYAETVAGLTTTTGLLARGLSILPGFLGPIGVAFLVFEAASAAIGKAFNDLQKLIDLGERAEKLDLSAPFVKTFEGLAPKIRATSDELDAALGKASAYLKDQWGQFSNLSKLFNEINATGAAGAGGLKATALADTATTVEQRIKAAVAGMKELDELGLHLAAIQVGEKVFGPEFMERLRTGQTTIAQFSADLDAASEKQVVNQEAVDRAVALNKQIADVKQAISDAWSVTIDWSAAAMLVNEAWLKVLQAVLWIVEAINKGITAIGNFGAAILSSVGTAFDIAMDKATDFLAMLRIINKEKKKPEVQGPPEEQGPQLPPITARTFPYVFGPTAPAPEIEKAGRAAKQAKQAAAEAVSAYDSLIQRTKDRIEELDLEAASVGKTEGAVIKLKLAHDLERAAKKSNTPVTEEMRAEWDKLGTSLAEATERTNQAKRAFEQLKEGQREIAGLFETFFEDILTGSKSMSQAFAEMGKSITSSGLKAILTGEGPLAGMMGTANPEKGQVGGLLGGIMPSAFKDAVEKGSEKGTSSGVVGGLGDLFGGKNGSSLLKGAAGIMAIAGSYGAGQQASSKSGALLSGAMSGAVGGMMLGTELGAVGGPAGMAIGAAAGGIMALLGFDNAQKQKIKQQKDQWIKDYKDALPEINKFRSQLRGEAQSGNAATIKQAYDQMVKAWETAVHGGDNNAGISIETEFKQFQQRLFNDFVRGFEGTFNEMTAGLGTNGPFQQAIQAVQQMGDGLKAFVADAQQFNIGAEGITRAQHAAMDSALAMLEPAKQLSAVATEMGRISGTAAALQTVLEQLGAGAEDAARIISEHMVSALDGLRSNFDNGVGRKLTDAQGKGYLNDASDLQTEVEGMFRDAGLIGGSAGQVDQYFTAAAQKIVDEAGLTGAAFQELLVRFPALNGRIHEFVAALTDTSTAATDAADALAKQQERAAAAHQALVDGFKADLQAAQVQVDTARTALQASYDAEASTLNATIDRLSAFGDAIRKFKSGLLLDQTLSPLSPQQKYLEAQRQFRDISGKAAAGDETAQGQLQDASQAYLNASKDYYASSEKYYADFREVSATLDHAADTAQGQLDQARAQLSALQVMVAGLVTINSSVLSVKDAIAALQGALAAQAAVQAAAAASGPLMGGATRVDAAGSTLNGLYQSLLGRDADQAGLSFYAGMSQAAIVQSILASPEYASRGMVEGGVVGNGAWNRDSVLAAFAGGGQIALAGGEHVMPAPQTAMYLPQLEAMRAGRYSAANDDGLKSEIQGLRAEVRSLRAVTAQGHIETVAAVKQGTAQQAETGTALKRARVASR